VLSAGSLSTPQILERSGIGSSTRLSSLGIPPVADLPGVGENYQDHNRLPAGVARIEGSPDDTADQFLRGDPETVARWQAEYATGQGPMAWNFVDAGGKLNPSPAELEGMGPDFQKIWQEHFMENPDKSTITIAIAALYSSRATCLT
jgi:alcohol oxidase